MAQTFIDKITFHSSSKSGIHFSVDDQSLPKEKCLTFQCAITVSNTPSIILDYDINITKQFMNSQDIALIIHDRFISLKINQKTSYLVGFSDDFIHLVNQKKQLYIQVNDLDKQALDGILFEL